MHVTHPHRRRPALLTAAAALAVAGPLISAPPASAVTPSAAEVSPHAAQTIDNIGASGAWWVNDLKNFDPKVQARVAKLLFSEDGLALSSYRYNIGGGGTGVTYAPRAPEDFLNDDGSYDWSKDKAGRTFLNFGEDWRSDFTVSIAAKPRRQLAEAGLDPGAMQGKMLRVRGWIKSRNGPLIEIVQPEQVEVVIE